MVDKLNKNQVVEAAEALIRLAREEDEAALVCSEMERELMDVRRRAELEVEGELGRKLREVEEDLRRLKLRRLKLLTLYAVQVLSRGNPVIMNVARRDDIDTTHTYL